MAQSRLADERRQFRGVVGALLFMAVIATQPSTEALRLGREAAQTGELATMLPLLEAKETEELIAAHPELASADKEKLKATADKVYRSGREKLLSATAVAYARHLSIDDLRHLLAFRRSAAGRHYRAAMPAIILESSTAAGKLDFKGDVLAAFCRESGKLCAK